MSTKYLIFAVLLLIGIGATIGVMGTPWTPRRDVSADIILPSPEVIAMVYASKGFQYLVSYTDTGFEPKDFTINKGETVRFGNNSSHDMWISESSHTAPTVCNNSTFNSCRAIKPGMFWEHTFDTIDTLQYEDTLNPNNTGVISIN